MKFSSRFWQSSIKCLLQGKPKRHGPQHPTNQDKVAFSSSLPIQYTLHLAHKSDGQSHWLHFSVLQIFLHEGFLWFSEGLTKVTEYVICTAPALSPVNGKYSLWKFILIQMCTAYYIWHSYHNKAMCIIFRTLTFYNSS